MVVFAYTVGTTEEKICSRQPARTSIIVINNHATAVIYIRSSKGVSPGNGLPIAAGGNFVMKIPEDNPTQEVWCISDTITTSVRVYEGYGYAVPK